MTKRSAIFLDRDGVINIPIFKDGRSYAPTSLQAIQYFPQVPEAIKLLKKMGYMLIVVTNQPDVGNGKLSLQEAQAINAKIAQELNLDTIKACFHKQSDNCLCRKPRPGMLHEAIEELCIDRHSSFMIGDRASDVEAAKTASIPSIFIDLGYDPKVEPKPQSPDYSVDSLYSAAKLIHSLQSPSTT